MLVEVVQPRAGELGAGELAGVVERFEQGERAACVREREFGCAFGPGGVRERAMVEDARPWERVPLGQFGALDEQGAGALGVAACVEGETQVGAVADLQERIARVLAPVAR